jgi:hypothetical protein
MGLINHANKQGLLTAAILVLAFLLDLSWARPDPELQLAQQWLGETAHRVELESGPAFQLGSKWLLFFNQPGKVGPIRGAVVIDDDQIKDLLIFEAYDGIERDAFAPWHIADFMDEQIARAPIEANAVSGATISSQLLMDAINRCLKEWRAAVR